MKRSAFVLITAAALTAVLALSVGFVVVNVHAADQTMPEAGQVAPTFTLP